MIVADFIKEFGLDAFCERTKIKPKFHSAYPNLVQFKYNQIESPMDDPLVQACRGLILDSNDWSVVAFPFSKFWNIFEPLAANVNWTFARAYEKLDGSCIVLYHYNQDWHVATLGSPDASGDVPTAVNKTFAQLFWEIFSKLNYKLPDDTGACYMFELLSPQNRIVVPYTEDRLVLHGARALVASYPEMRPEFYARRYGWECVKSFDIDNSTDILAMADSLNGLEQEGFVVCDNNFNRIKIKSKHYVDLHYLKSTLSIRRILEIIMKNEGSEFLQYFPEYKTEFDKLELQFNHLSLNLDLVYEQYATIESQKDFALAVKHLPFSAGLFATRAKKVAKPSEWLRQQDSRKVMLLMGIDSDNEQAMFRKVDQE